MRQYRNSSPGDRDPWVGSLEAWVGGLDAWLLTLSDVFPPIFSARALDRSATVVEDKLSPEGVFAGESRPTPPLTPLPDI